MEQDMGDFLKPSYFCESDDPKIKELAEKITKGKKTEIEKAETLFEWVRENVAYDIIPMVGAEAVLKKKPMVAMCYDKTNLFIALCRAVGIPARYINLDVELKVNRSDISPKAKHIVAEVFVNKKWTLADPSFERSLKILIEPSQFGVPTWRVAKKFKRTKGISRVMVFLANNLLIHMPFFKKLRKAIQEAKANQV